MIQALSWESLMHEISGRWHISKHIVRVVMYRTFPHISRSMEDVKSNMKVTTEDRKE